jgi:hypothetical protein
MSETRRQIFKASVLSAFGLMAAPALSGCTGNASLFGHGEGDPNVPIVGKGDGNDPYWYIIVFVPDAAQDGAYQVWRTSDAPPARPFDTAEWYSELKGRNRLEQATGSFTIGQHTFVMNGPYLEGPSTSALQYAVRVKWSEVGKV